MHKIKHFIPAKSRNLSHRCCQKSADFPQNCCRCLCDRNILSAITTSFISMLFLQWSVDHQSPQTTESMQNYNWTSQWWIYLLVSCNFTSVFRVQQKWSRSKQAKRRDWFAWISLRFFLFVSSFRQLQVSCVCWMKCKHNIWSCAIHALRDQVCGCWYDEKKHFFLYFHLNKQSEAAKYRKGWSFSKKSQKVWVNIEVQTSTKFSLRSSYGRILKKFYEKHRVNGKKFS